ncbi:hypothetical protein K435DRAFT_799690 [Dendrothele bispora CBS 962.96]|uniref:Uncharacterized protein n=1 Tax=Dendrothele bispora (strain CBS 962.96) TaxID=1314807 RepID=A0A4S8LV61_DENBC|nr:hypothetical protein K435DRAFT_799690 [Dendrothele bispora CBS 962.96]
MKTTEQPLWRLFKSTGIVTPWQLPLGTAPSGLLNGSGAGNFPVAYSIDSANVGVSGQSSPAQGATFALLALSMPNQTIKLSSATTTTITSPLKSNVGVIAGGIVGGLVGLAVLLIAVTLAVGRRRKLDRQKGSKEMQDTAISAHPESNQLRQEVEGLRREMHDLRIQVGGYESPPSYRSLSPTLMIGGERLRTSNIFGPAPTSVMIGDRPTTREE